MYLLTSTFGRIMKKNRLLFVVLVALTISGCVPPTQNIKPDVINAIAYCSAGIDSDTTAHITAKIAERGGEFSAGVADELKGVFMNKPGITEENAVNLHKNYVECMDRKTASEKQALLERCASTLKCEIEKLDSACRCRTATEGVAQELGLSEKEKNKQLAKNCYSGGYSMQACWGKSDMEQGRAECVSILERASSPLPTAAPGSCLAKES
ncbi:hypothetical protein ACCC96_01645 [Pseudomonas sp. Pseusp11]|uniref:hypothetical protein n=1 Tax=Pseudomonas sp. Pseusp11 TaxID=3243003 RepID=UPI0039B4DCCA